MKEQKGKTFGRRSGMTLIEMTAAVVITGIISSYAFAQAAAYTDRAKYSRAAEEIAAITAALSISYLEHCGSWQAREGTGRTGRINGLDPIFAGDNVTEHIGRRLSKRPESIKDPWGNPYIIYMTEEGGSMTAVVCCMNDTYDFNSDVTGANNGNNGNGNGSGSNNGKHNGWENGNGGSNNGNGNGPGSDSGNHYGNGNGNGGNSGNNENTPSGRDIRLNIFAGNKPMSATLTLH